MVLHDRRHLGDGDGTAGFSGQGGHPGVADAARDDTVVPGQVAVAVQREPVHGDAPSHPRAYRAHLSVRPAPVLVTRYPGAAATRHAPGRDAELRARQDHRLLERAHVGDHVQRLAELDDRVTSQLPGTVPGDLAAAVHVDDRCPRVAERPVGHRGPLAGRVHGLVLEHQAAVGHLVGHPPSVHAPLQIPALAVLHGSGAEAKIDKLTHFPQFTSGRAAGLPDPPRGQHPDGADSAAAGRRTMRS